MKKELFPGCLTTIFEYDEKEDQDVDPDFVDFDPEIMYSLAVKKNDKIEEV